MLIFKIDCLDTPLWTDEGNNPCSHYSGFCENGAITSGNDWILEGGSHYNHPENNCCICGKDEYGMHVQ